MRILKNIVKKDLSCLIDIRNIILSFIVFISIILFTFLNLGDMKSKITIEEFIFLNLGGSTIEYINFFDFLKWFTPIILFSFYICIFIYKEWDGRYIYSLIRAKSIKNWVLSKLISISIISILYVLFYNITLAVFYKISIGNQVFIQEIKLIILNIILMIFTLIVISTLIFLLSLFVKEAIYTYLITCIILIEPFLIGFIPTQLLYFFIGENAMFLRHNFFLNPGLNLSISYSFIYFIISELILIFLIGFIIKRKDFN